MSKLRVTIERQSDWLKMAVCLLFTLLLGVTDYITGDLSLIVFYVIPIALAIWFVGKKTGLFISLLSGAELFVTSLLVAPMGFPMVSIRTWNALMEALFLVFTGYVFHMLKFELEQKRQRALMLEAANQELEAFNYSVSHDLRKPITIINGYCEVILNISGSKLDSQSQQYLKEINKWTLRMDDLIDALLKFSNLSHCELHRQEVDLSSMAHLVAAELRLAEAGRRVTFRIAEGVTGFGDKKLLRVVLENLLGNAWKYSANQEEAVIEFGMTIWKGDPTCFVRDNGIGFDMAEAGNMFIPFHRMHGSDEFKGHGIGLATVDRIIRRHEGRVWAEGEPGKGATFYFIVG